jgi:hypothetical protein
VTVRTPILAISDEEAGRTLALFVLRLSLPAS